MIERYLQKDLDNIRWAFESFSCSSSLLFQLLLSFTRAFWVFVAIRSRRNSLSDKKPLTNFFKRILYIKTSKRFHWEVDYYKCCYCYCSCSCCSTYVLLLLLLFSSFPLVLSSEYPSRLSFPLFGSVRNIY